MEKLGQFFLTEPNGHYIHMCPACKSSHAVAIKTTYRDNWSFNDNLEVPTITPSVRITKLRPGFCCHYNITDGKIFYHGDCSHAFAGKTVDMIPIERMVMYGENNED